MGYRSEIVFVIEGDVTPVIMQFSAEYMKMSAPEDLPEGTDNATFIKSILDFCTITQDSLTFHGEDWKWYSDYPDIIALTRLFTIADEGFEEHGWNVHGKFLRIGEEHDDIEDKTFGDEDIDCYIQTSIDKGNYKFKTN